MGTDCLRSCEKDGVSQGRTVRCAKSGLFSTTRSYGSQGPEFCIPCCFELVMHTCRWVVFRGVPGINNVIIGAVPALCENAPIGFS